MYFLEYSGYEWNGLYRHLSEHFYFSPSYSQHPHIGQLSLLAAHRGMKNAANYRDCIAYFARLFQMGLKIMIDRSDNGLENT